MFALGSSPFHFTGAPPRYYGILNYLLESYELAAQERQPSGCAKNLRALLVDRRLANLGLLSELLRELTQFLAHLAPPLMKFAMSS